MARIVVALGGNALGENPSEQKENVKIAAKVIADLIEQNNELIITHGNGPQIGMINTGLSYSASAGIISSEMPFPECGAMSQGYIGYHLQNALSDELHLRKINTNAVTVITRVEVDADDAAFKEYTKPIGPFYSKTEAQKIIEENPDYIFKEDSMRGYRRVVPSPIPVDILEKDSICALLNSGFTVIACGGGGIPVVRKVDGSYTGVSCVIDKDLASECLAEIVDADLLYILTAVDGAYLNYSNPERKLIHEMTCADAEKYCNEGQFAAGSMLPKVKAGIKFASSKEDRKAVICSLSSAVTALSDSSGTTIVR